MDNKYLPYIAAGVAILAAGFLYSEGLANFYSLKMFAIIMAWVATNSFVLLKFNRLIAISSFVGGLAVSAIAVLSWKSQEASLGEPWSAELGLFIVVALLSFGFAGLVWFWTKEKDLASATSAPAVAPAPTVSAPASAPAAPAVVDTTAMARALFDALTELSSRRDAATRKLASDKSLAAHVKTQTGVEDVSLATANQLEAIEAAIGTYAEVKAHRERMLDQLRQLLQDAMTAAGIEELRFNGQTLKLAELGDANLETVESAIAAFGEDEGRKAAIITFLEEEAVVPQKFLRELTLEDLLLVLYLVYLKDETWVDQHISGKLQGDKLKAIRALRPTDDYDLFSLSLLFVKGREIIAPTHLQALVNGHTMIRPAFHPRPPAPALVTRATTPAGAPTPETEGGDGEVVGEDIPDGDDPAPRPGDGRPQVITGHS